MVEPTTATQPQNTEAAATTTKHCTYCSEEATGKTENGVLLCNIPGNHPEYDGEELLPIHEIP